MSGTAEADGPVFSDLSRHPRRRARVLVHAYPDRRDLGRELHGGAFAWRAIEGARRRRTPCIRPHPAVATHAGAAGLLLFALLFRPREQLAAPLTRLAHLQETKKEASPQDSRQAIAADVLHDDGSAAACSNAD